MILVGASSSLVVPGGATFSSAGQWSRAQALMPQVDGELRFHQGNIGFWLTAHSTGFEFPLTDVTEVIFGANDSFRIVSLHATELFVPMVVTHMAMSQVVGRWQRIFNFAGIPQFQSAKSLV